MVYNIPIFVSQHQETTAFLKEEQFVNRRQISCELFTIYFTAVNSFYWGKNIIEIKSFPQWGFHGQFMGLVKCWLIYFHKQMTDNKRECHNFKCSFYSKFSNFPYDPACPSVGWFDGWSVWHNFLEGREVKLIKVRLTDLTLFWFKFVPLRDLPPGAVLYLLPVVQAAPLATLAAQVQPTNHLKGIYVC